MNINVQRRRYSATHIRCDLNLLQHRVAKSKNLNCLLGGDVCGGGGGGGGGAPTKESARQ